MYATTLQQMREVQKRILALRELTQDKRYSSEAKAGKLRLTRVTYNATGSSEVTPESDWMDYASFIAFLDSQMI